MPRGRPKMKRVQDGDGFFGDLWEGIKDGVRLPYKAAKALSEAIGIKPSDLVAHPVGKLGLKAIGLGKKRKRRGGAQKPTCGVTVGSPCAGQGRRRVGGSKSTPFPLFESNSYPLQSISNKIIPPPKHGHGSESYSEIQQNVGNYPNSSGSSRIKV